MIEEYEDGDILTFSILWLSGECDDGDFDFFDIVTDWGVWWWWFWLFRYCDWVMRGLGRGLGVLQQKQDQKNLLMNSIYSDGFDYIGL